MPHAKSRWLLVMARWSLGIVVGLAFCVPFVAAAQSDDEVRLRTLAEKFFAAYQREDLDDSMALWSATSPDLAASRQSFQQTFADVEKMELKGLTLRRLTLDGEKATVRVVIDMNATDAKTGKPAAEFGKLDRTFHCVKEGEDWKVWRYLPSEEDLAAALVTARTEEARDALLAAEKGLVTITLVRALGKQGERYITQGSYPQALTVLKLTLSIAQRVADKTGIANTFRSIGVVHYLQGHYEEALEHFQRSLKLHEELDNKTGIARALSNIGSVYYAQGSYQHALGFYQKSLDLLEELGNKAAIVSVLGNFGNILSLQGNYTQALEYYEKGLKLADELGDKDGIARSLNALGSVHHSQGNYAQALEYARKSLRLNQELSNKLGIASSASGIGKVSFSQGNYLQALEYYHKNLELREQMGNRMGVGIALDNIGNVHYAQGNYKLALEYHQKSLKLAEELGNNAVIIRALVNIGAVYSSEGDYKQALEYYNKSLRLAEASGDEAAIAATLSGIGDINYSHGDYESALEQYYKSLKLQERLGGKIDIARTLNQIGDVQYAQANYATAVELYNRASALAIQMGAPEILWYGRARAGKAHRALNQPDQAGKAFVDAIANIEKLRTQLAGGEQEQQRFFENKISPYYAMAELLIDQSNPAEAFAYAERAKGRVLLDVLQSGRVKIIKTMTALEQERERKLNADLVSLNTQIYRERQRQQPDDTRLADLSSRVQRARLEYEAFQTTLYAGHPELKAQRAESSPLTLKETGALIPDTDTALLEFVVMEDKTYLFVLTRNKDTNQAVPDLKVYKLETKQKDLADLAQRFRQRLASHDFSFYDIASQLYELLLQPARAQLKHKTNLVIVPDGVLWELPFQALQPARNRYLIEDYAVSYAPSLTVLREMMKPRANQTQSTTAFPTLLAFGNPAIGKETAERVKSVFMDEQLLPLPEAERQVRMLRRLYGIASSKVYVGADAREDRVKLEASKCRILHLATHGILNNASPMYSHLVLSQPKAGGGEDGLLEAWEIMNLELNADLVVLSACDTARGRVGAGEGVIGLAWALFVAGCPTTVASQWKVESSSTTELMVELHRNLKPRIENPESKITKAQALRLAALKLIRTKRYRHPFYWAGFVMVGNGR